MRETIKIICVLVLMVGAVAAALSWADERPDALQWSLRIGAPVFVLVSLVLFLKIHFRADLAHDYLREYASTYFNRDGFCFSFSISKIDGIAYMDAYFQNQRDQPCIGRIALRPALGFFLTRSKIDIFTFWIKCAPGAFGYTRLAIPIPEKLQGKSQSFEIGASVEYPEGKGKQLRFFDGMIVRHNTNFGNTLGTVLVAAGALTGTIVLPGSPPKITVTLPADVAEVIPYDIEPETTTLWRLGDPPLEKAD